MDGRIREFQAVVWAYYREHGRHDLPWRQLGADGGLDPYAVLVSEVMLQQTQVSRVRPKFQSFLAVFPDVASLAAAPLGDVLREWSGLGYNRRAKFLWQAAGQVVQRHGGILPDDLPELVKLPGIGLNTAGAVLAYAYNKPTIFVETNIRTVFIHHFFADQTGVRDSVVLDMVARALPDDARRWYWALMDYGTHLKQTVGNLNKLSSHYAVQSRFAGSRRQLRGRVLRLLGDQSLSGAELADALQDERTPLVLEALTGEGLIVRTKAGYKLPGA